MRKLIILFTLFSSFSAFADIKCQVDTIKNLDIVSSIELASSKGHIQSGHLAELNKERNRPNHKISLYLYGTISGWENEEFLEAVIYRNDFKYAKHNTNVELTEKFILKGTDNKVFEFEDYKIEVKCTLI